MTDVPSFLSSLAPLTVVDHDAFGSTKAVKLSRLQQLTAKFLGRNWVTIPHVTHHDEVDVTVVEERRAAWNSAGVETKITPVVVLIKALALTLAEFPQFNASIANDGQTLILKDYVNIGVAVDTPGGLLVPVLRGVNHKGLSQIASELTLLADKARMKGLSMTEMSGSSICLSSLGHIGGTAFTPIINAPDIAILGATAIQTRAAPAEDGSITWRKMLPLSLSYDHRAINGADAARFVRAVGAALATPEMFA